MTKYIALFAAAMTLLACESSAEVKEDIESLRKERTALQNENAWLRETKASKENEIATLDEHLEESHIYQSGRTPKYVLGIKLEQSHSEVYRFFYEVNKQSSWKRHDKRRQDRLAIKRRAMILDRKRPLAAFSILPRRNSLRLRKHPRQEGQPS